MLTKGEGSGTYCSPEVRRGRTKNCSPCRGHRHIGLKIERWGVVREIWKCDFNLVRWAALAERVMFDFGYKGAFKPIEFRFCEKMREIIGYQDRKCPCNRTYELWVLHAHHRKRKIRKHHLRCFDADKLGSKQIARLGNDTFRRRPSHKRSERQNC